MEALGGIRQVKCVLSLSVYQPVFRGRVSDWMFRAWQGSNFWVWDQQATNISL